jgi:hypothetical protein
LVGILSAYGLVGASVLLLGVAGLVGASVLLGVVVLGGLSAGVL